MHTQGYILGRLTADTGCRGFNLDLGHKGGCAARGDCKMQYCVGLSLHWSP